MNEASKEDLWSQPEMLRSFDAKTGLGEQPGQGILRIQPAMIGQVQRSIQPVPELRDRGDDTDFEHENTARSQQRAHSSQGRDRIREMTEKVAMVDDVEPGVGPVEIFD